MLKVSFLSFKISLGLRFASATSGQNDAFQSFLDSYTELPGGLIRKNICLTAWSCSARLQCYRATTHHAGSYFFSHSSTNWCSLRSTHLALRVVSSGEWRLTILSDSFSNCAATRTSNGYSCAICKSAYRCQGISWLAELFLNSDWGLCSLFDLSFFLADLRPASHLEAIVGILRSLRSTVSTMILEQDAQLHIPGTFFFHSMFAVYEI